MIFLRSRENPGIKNYLDKELSLVGGEFRAYTIQFQTEFNLTTPENELSYYLPKVVRQIFDPIFIDEDIRVEKEVIKNERNQRKYFPGKDELTEHMYTRWMNECRYEKEQLFGSNAVLDSITKEQLYDFHKNYFNKDIKVVVGGRFDLELVKKIFSKIKTKEIPLHNTPKEIVWIKKEYNELKLTDVNMNHLVLGGFNTKKNQRINCQIGFIGDYLTNTAHGSLYNWLRNKKCYIYAIESGLSDYQNACIWHINVPLDESRYADEIRNKIDEIIIKALQDKKGVQIEVQRQLAERIYYYQTLKSRLDNAVDTLSTYGKIYTESDYQTCISECTDTEHLMRLYMDYYSPGKRGEFLAVPKGDVKNGI